MKITETQPYPEEPATTLLARSVKNERNQSSGLPVTPKEADRRQEGWNHQHSQKQKCHQREPKRVI